MALISTMYWMFIPKNAIFLFSLLGILGLKNILTTNDSKMVIKILFGLESFKFLEDRITVVEIDFSQIPFENLTDKEKWTLS